MSVINQMLLDLEHRRAQPAGASSLSAFVRPLPLGRTPRLPAWIVNACAAVVIGVLAGYAASQWLAPMQADGRSEVSAPVAGDSSAPSAARAQPILAEQPVIDVAARNAATPEQIVVASVSLRNAAIDVPVNELGVFAHRQSTPAEVRSSEVLPESVSGHVSTPSATPPTERTRHAEPAPRQRANASDAAKPARPLKSDAPTVVAPAEVVAVTSPPAAEPVRALEERSRPRAQVTPAPQPSTPLETKPAQLEKRVSAQQRADNEYRLAVNLLGQGKNEEARAALVRIVAEYPQHDSARQALIGLLMQARKANEAEALADERLATGSDHTGFAMISARLKFERGDLAAASATLQRSAQHAQSNAEYIAFTAAVLQRLSRHGEAVEQYRNALRLNPGSGVWLMGLGMSLQALERTAEARAAFERARAVAGLAPDLRAFVDQRIGQLER